MQPYGSLVRMDDVDRTNLKLRGSTWSCTVSIPKKYWRVLGKQLTRSLGTASLAEARRLRHRAVAESRTRSSAG